MSKKILFQFPGRGSQAVGMGTLAGRRPSGGARRLRRGERRRLGEDLFALMKDGPEEDLRLTRNAQPALFAASMAALAVLRQRHQAATSLLTWLPLLPGIRLGEYRGAGRGRNTLCRSRTPHACFACRGDSMQGAVPAGEGAMAAILGAEEDRCR